jgi:polysaccharide pyruvyl transferase WcaK-like protein
VLRSSWQVISLADSAQTLGDLALLEKHHPAAAVTLWPMYLNDAGEQMIRRRFPKVAIVRGQVDRTTYRPVEPALADVLSQTDFVVHGSGPQLSSPEALEAARVFKKPFGVFGLTVNETDERLLALLTNARGVFARDSATLDALRLNKLAGPAMGLSPDAAFAADARDDATAMAFLKSVGLADGSYLVVVPKLRYTPFRKYFPPEEVARRQAISNQFAEADHAIVREAIVAWVRQTGRRVLVVPELKYQLELAAKWVIDPLPPDVRRAVVRRETFWLPDEAASVFARAGLVLGFELNPLVMATAAGVPAIQLQHPTDGRKNRMPRDVGLGEAVFDADDITGEKLAAVVTAIGKDPAAAVARAKKCIATVAELHARAMATIA